MILFINFVCTLVGIYEGDYLYYDHNAYPLPYFTDPTNPDIYINVIQFRLLGIRNCYEWVVSYINVPALHVC